jgi:hypothetical protein
MGLFIINSATIIKIISSGELAMLAVEIAKRQMGQRFIFLIVLFL